MEDPRIRLHLAADDLLSSLAASFSGHADWLTGQLEGVRREKERLAALCVWLAGTLANGRWGKLTCSLACWQLLPVWLNITVTRRSSMAEYPEIPIKEEEKQGGPAYCC